MADPLTAILGGLLGMGVGALANMAAAGVNLVSAFLANLDNIVLLYVASGMLYGVTLGLSEVNPFIRPFEAAYRIELGLLTPVTGLDSMNPIYYDLEAIIDPFSYFGGRAKFDEIRSESSDYEKGLMDDAVEALEKAQDTIYMIIGWIGLIGTLSIKYSLFVDLNYRLITGIWAWYGSCGINSA